MRRPSTAIWTIIVALRLAAGNLDRSTIEQINGWLIEPRRRCRRAGARQCPPPPPHAASTASARARCGRLRSSRAARAAERAAIGARSPRVPAAALGGLESRGLRVAASSRPSAAASPAASCTMVSAPCCAQHARDLGAVELLRSRQHRQPERRRLEQVVAADRHQAAADEGHIGRGIEVHQLAERIEQQHLRLSPRLRAAASGARSAKPCAAIDARPRPRSAADGAAPAPAAPAAAARAAADAPRARSAPRTGMGAARDPHRAARRIAARAVPRRAAAASGWQRCDRT